MDEESEEGETVDVDASSIVSVETLMRWILRVSVGFASWVAWCILPIGVDSLLHR